MHVLAMAVAAAVVHVGLVRLRLARGPLLAGALVLLVAVGLLVRPDTVFESVTGGPVVLAALVTASTRRQVRIVTDAMAAAAPSSGPAHASGGEFVTALQTHGFVLASDGWASADGLDWGLVALQRGPVRVFVVDAGRGPSMDVSTVLDNGRVLATTAAARERVPPAVVRQCLPSDDALELVAHHEAALAAAIEAGRAPVARRMDDLTAAAVADEVARGRHVLRGGVFAAAVSTWRELFGAEDDLGPVTDHPADWDRLVADPT